MSFPAADERQPLVDRDAEPPKKPTPLPKGQLSVLLYTRMIDPINYYQILPYINRFIAGTGVETPQVGILSGYVEGIFSLAQLIGMYHWAKLSDSYGRRQTILAGAVFLTITSILFGFSTTFLWALVCRGLAGLSSGNLALLPTNLLEITDESNRPYALSLFGVMYTVGSVIGSTIGGFFSDSATVPPVILKLFEHFINLQKYPCFLPSSIVFILNLITAVIVYCYLKETKVVSRFQLAVADNEYTPRRLFRVPAIRALLSSGLFLGFNHFAFDVVFVLLCFTPIEYGGLSMTNAQIGIAQSLASIVSCILLMVVIPQVLAKHNVFKVYSRLMCFWPLAFLGFLMLHTIAKYSQGQWGIMGIPFLLWIALGIVLLLGKIAVLPYAINSILVEKSIPNSSARAKTMALVQASATLPRVFSPPIVSYFFILSNDLGIRWLWVFFMVLVSFGGIFVSSRVVRYSSNLKKRDEPDNDSDIRN